MRLGDLEQPVSSATPACIGLASSVGHVSPAILTSPDKVQCCFMSRVAAFP